MCEELNKDSISQWIFCRVADSFSYSTEGTDLQVLEVSQGGLHPQHEPDVIASFCFLFLDHMLIFKTWFSYCFKILTWFLKYFDSMLIFIFDFISFHFKFTLLSCFHTFNGLIRCMYF